MKSPLFIAAVVAAFAGASVVDAATVLVTGSNRGLGYEFVRQYAAQGWTVIATTRNPESAPELKELAAKNKNIVIEKLDVLDLPGIKALAAKYQGQAIDVLLNNAGESALQWAEYRVVVDAAPPAAGAEPPAAAQVAEHKALVALLEARGAA